MRPDGPRDDYAGPEAGPEPPYPIRLYGPVIKGFGRGSKDLGIPTANIPPTTLEETHPDLPTGVYFGFVGLILAPTSQITPSTTTNNSESNSTSASSPPTPNIYPAVLSIGFNPFYKNTVKSIEIHVLHAFGHDFYHCPLNLLILGFIRPEYDYISVESLIDDIKTDCDVARRSLARPGYARLGMDDQLKDFTWVAKEGLVDEEAVQKIQGEVLGQG